MKRHLTYISLILATIFIGAFLIWGSFRVKRWFHYVFSYESKVEQTVKKLVKDSCLKEAAK